jgi:hypothetical protein
LPLAPQRTRRARSKTFRSWILPFFCRDIALVGGLSLRSRSICLVVWCLALWGPRLPSSCGQVFSTSQHVHILMGLHHQQKAHTSSMYLVLCRSPAAGFLDPCGSKARPIKAASSYLIYEKFSR